MGRHWASFFPQDKLPQTVSSLGPFLPGTPLTREASTITKEVLHSSMFPACSSSWETSLHFQTLVQLSPLEKALLFLLAEDPIQGLVHSKHTLYHWAKSPVHQKTPPLLPPKSLHTAIICSCPYQSPLQGWESPRSGLHFIFFRTYSP